MTERKRILITGASDGIGRATAIALAQRGHHVVLHGRDRIKLELAAQAAKALNGGGEVDTLVADFSDMAQVLALASVLQGRFARLDVLVNNAAAMFSERRETADGYEANFGVNYLAPVALTLRLLPMLQAAGRARIVNLSSVGYKQAKPRYDDLQVTHGYAMQREYFNSKLFLLYFTQVLAAALPPERITANAAHPGGVQTQLARDFKGPMRWLFALMMPLVFTSPDKGADTSVYLADDPAMNGLTGGYYVKRRLEPLTAIGRDTAARATLWQQTVALLQRHGVVAPDSLRG